MTNPIIDKLEESLREFLVSIASHLADNQFISDTPPTPVNVIVQQPLPMRMFTVTNTVIAQAIFYTLRRPRSFITMVDTGTSAIAYGIRRVLHLGRRSNMAPAAADIPLPQ